MQEELVGLGARAAKRPLRLVADPVGLALRPGCRVGRVGRGDPRLFERRAELGALSLRLEQGALERAMELGEVRVRASQNALVQTQALGDGEGVGCARQSDMESERRTKGVRIELHARVAHSRRVEREGLQLRVVRRRGDEDAALEQRFEHGHRERRTFVRIGSRADLVEKREVATLGVGERRDDVAKVRRERGEGLRDRLLVADVSEDAADDRHAAAVGGQREAA